MGVVGQANGLRILVALAVGTLLLTLPLLWMDLSGMGLRLARTPDGAPATVELRIDPPSGVWEAHIPLSTALPEGFGYEVELRLPGAETPPLEDRDPRAGAHRSDRSLLEAQGRLAWPAGEAPALEGRRVELRLRRPRGDAGRARPVILAITGTYDAAAGRLRDVRDEKPAAED